MKFFLFHTLFIFILTQITAQAELVGYWKLDGDFTDIDDYLEDLG